VKVPVAVNWSVPPFATVGDRGAIEIDCNAAALTVRTVVLLIPLSVALIVDVPVATPVARPVDAPIVATLVVAEAHVT
jgi:hypothetical protein